MFDEILAYLYNQDTTGYPIPENLEFRLYTLEGKVDAMLDDLWEEYRDDLRKAADILNVQKMLSNGYHSWLTIMEEMERLSTKYENEEEEE